jgi:hypothetical protein
MYKLVQTKDVTTVSYDNDDDGGDGDGDGDGDVLLEV